MKTERPIKEKEEADDSQGRTDMKSKWVLTEVAMLLGALLAFLSLPEVSLSHSLHKLWNTLGSFALEASGKHSNRNLLSL